MDCYDSRSCPDGDCGICKYYNENIEEILTDRILVQDIECKKFKTFYHTKRSSLTQIVPMHSFEHKTDKDFGLFTTGSDNFIFISIDFKAVKWTADCARTLCLEKFNSLSEEFKGRVMSVFPDLFRGMKRI